MLVYPFNGCLNSVKGWSFVCAAHTQNHPGHKLSSPHRKSQFPETCSRCSVGPVAGSRPEKVQINTVCFKSSISPLTGPTLNRLFCPLLAWQTDLCLALGVAVSLGGLRSAARCLSSFSRSLNHVTPYIKAPLLCSAVCARSRSLSSSGLLLMAKNIHLQISSRFLLCLRLRFVIPCFFLLVRNCALTNPRREMVTVVVYLFCVTNGCSCLGMEKICGPRLKGNWVTCPQGDTGLMVQVK